MTYEMTDIQKINLLLNKVLERMDDIEIQVMNNGDAILNAHKSILDISNEDALKKFIKRQEREELFRERLFDIRMGKEYTQCDPNNGRI